MKLSQTIARTRAKKNVRGQGMSEYLIIVALIAVAGIAVMGLFGGAARNQVAAMANEIGGGAQSDSDDLNRAAEDYGDTAVAEAGVAVSLENFGGNTETLKNGTSGTASRTAITE